MNYNVLDITDEVNSMTDSDRSNIIKKFDKHGFTERSNISINNNELQSKVNSDSLKVNISNILTQYNDKYGTNFKYEDIQNSLITLININSTEKEIRKLIDSQIITNISEILTTKAILVISKVISDQLDRISSITENSGLNPELIGMIGEMFGWIEKLEVIKKKYQLYDTDSKIKSLLKGGSVNNLIRTKEQQEALDILKKVLIK